MDLQNLMTELQSKFGNKLDAGKVTEMFKGVDLKNFSMSDIIAKVKEHGLVGDLDGDGVEEGFIEEIKGKFGNLFGKK